MEDKFAKYTRLYVLIFLLFLSIPVIFGLIIAAFYGLSTVISSRPIDIAFELLVIALPPAVFATAYFIFFKRTKQHPSVIIKTISQIIFVIGFLACLFFLVLDIRSLFIIRGQAITDYHGFSVPFLAGNIGTLFFIAIVQAFTTAKEVDWMEKRRK